MMPNTSKPRNLACAGAGATLLVAVSLICAFLVSNRPGGQHQGDLLSSVPDQASSSIPSALGQHTEVPSTSPTTSFEEAENDANKTSSSSSQLWSKAPSNDPTAFVAVSEAPSSNTSLSEENSKSNDIGSYDDIEISDFKGPVADFLAAKDWARVQPGAQASISQNNGCKSNEGSWQFALQTDAYPWETKWELLSRTGDIIASGPPARGNYARHTRYVGRMCLETGRYTLRMKDTAGDGICCDWGEGSYSVFIDGDLVVESNDDDFLSVSHTFDINPPSSEDLCFTSDTYDAIDRDIAKLKNAIRNEQQRTHFIGGIVRLAAHDFMDFDPHRNRPMGPDGCFDPAHPINAGLPESIWCPTCELTMLYNEKYSHVTRADFWVAAANAVIRQTSVDNALDLKDGFLWGRKDAESCQGSGNRLPSAAGCGETEKVFLRRMGLEWKDAVALMGGHTLGRAGFSGHNGVWVGSDEEAQVFDKRYYDNVFTSVWWPSKMGHATQDWVTNDGGSLMLNTDICLVYDVEDLLNDDTPCCTKTDSRCIEPESAKRKCPMISRQHARWEAREAVQSMLGGEHRDDPNKSFYDAFAVAWIRATTVEQLL